MKSLVGQRILLTRAEEDSEHWADELKALGAAPVVLPCIDCETLADDARSERLRERLAQSDWIAFTSRRGVAAFAALHPQAIPAQLQVAAVGPATATAARDALGRVDLVAEGGTAASLGRALASAARGARAVLLVVAENAGDAIEKTLAGAGIACSRVDAYRTVPAAATDAPQALSALDVDNVFLASPSAVVGFLHRVRIDRAARLISIGPATSAALRRHGLEVTSEAREPTLRGLVEALQCTS